MSDIKLYGYSTSPFVRKVGCCLYYKQLPFEFVPVNPIDNSQIEFTGQTQVPVLQIGDEWRKDSTPLAQWLDELYPERPLFGRNEEEKAKIIAVDDWVSNSLILSGFRSVYESEMTSRLRHHAWRLANIVSSQTPLPDEIRNAWPDLLQTAPFIKHMMCNVDETESVKDMRARVGMELIQHLEGGPFFGGLSEPSLIDFAILPQVIFSYLVGLEDELVLAQIPQMKAWLRKITAYLPDNPVLVPDFMIINPIVDLFEELGQKSYA